MFLPGYTLDLPTWGTPRRERTGGVGFSIEPPCISWQLETGSDSTELKGLQHLDARAIIELGELSESDALRLNLPAFTATLLSCPAQHIGFGTKTALALGFAAALNSLFSGDLTSFELQKIVRRGGGSGNRDKCVFHRWPRVGRWACNRLCTNASAVQFATECCCAAAIGAMGIPSNLARRAFAARHQGNIEFRRKHVLLLEYALFRS